MAFTEPTACRNGHRFGPYKVLVGFLHCGCPTATGGGHLTYRCRIEGCEDRIVWECVDPSMNSTYQPKG